MRAADAELPSGQRRHRTLTEAEFRQICEDAELKSEPEFLLDYLHRAEIVFHRKDIFKDRIILDQSWALDAIYAVFNRTESYHQLRRFGGRFTRSLLETLVWRDHSPADQALFLDMMRSCGVCFVRRKGDAKAGVEAGYIAPELLPRRNEIEREIAAQWDADTPIGTQEYAYQFLHRGLIRGIIAEVGSEAGVSALYWRDGLCAYEETTRARALIQQQMDEGRWSGRIVVKRAAGRRGSCFHDFASSSTSSRIESDLKPFARRRKSRRPRKPGPRQCLSPSARSDPPLPAFMSPTLGPTRPIPSARQSSIRLAGSRRSAARRSSATRRRSILATASRSSCGRSAKATASSWC